MTKLLLALATVLTITTARADFFQVYVTSTETDNLYYGRYEGFQVLTIETENCKVKTFQEESIVTNDFPHKFTHLDVIKKIDPREGRMHYIIFTETKAACELKNVRNSYDMYERLYQQ